MFYTTTTHILHKVTIHIDVPTAMTGASRFGEQHRHHGWYYSKDESISTLSADAMAARHTHLLTTTPERYKPAFEELEMVRGYDGVHVERNTRRWTPWRREVDAVAVGPLVIRLRPQVSIMRRTKQV